MAPLPPTFALEPRFKEQFAQFLAQGFSPFNAAMRIWPTDGGLAAMVARDWPEDPYILAIQAREKGKEEAAAKPSTKTAQIKRIEARLANLSEAEYIKAERLLAEMSGHIEKAAPPSVNIDNRQLAVERVLIVKDHGDDDAWEAKLLAQQTKLVEHSR